MTLTAPIELLDPSSFQVTDKRLQGSLLPRVGGYLVEGQLDGMAGQSVDNVPEMLANRSGRGPISTDNETVSAGLKGPTGTARILWRSINELSDGLVNSFRKRRPGGLAELEPVLGLDEDVPAAFGDGTKVVHLLSGLAADLFDARRVQAPSGG